MELPSVICELSVNDAARVVGSLDDAKRQTEFLAEMAPRTPGELRGLVKYDPYTAGGLMTRPTITKIRDVGPKSVSVLDHDGEMLGVVTVDDAIDVIIPKELGRLLPRQVHHSNEAADF